MMFTSQSESTKHPALFSGIRKRGLLLESRTRKAARFLSLFLVLLHLPGITTTRKQHQTNLRKMFSKRAIYTIGLAMLYEEIRMEDGFSWIDWVIPLDGKAKT